MKNSRIIDGFLVRYPSYQLLWCDICDAEIECGEEDDIVVIAREMGWTNDGAGKQMCAGCLRNAAAAEPRAF
jgi:hypothetical protein